MSDIIGGWDNPESADYNLNDFDTHESETEATGNEQEFEGYYDNKSIVKAAKDLIDVYPEIEEDIDELVEIANESGVSLKQVCETKYAEGKLSSEDEDAFRMFKKKNPSYTRQMYIERIVNRDEYIDRVQKELYADAEHGRKLSESERKACDRLKLAQPEKNWTYKKYYERLKELGL